MRQPVPFGKYLLLDRISVGGMAEVFKAKSYGVEGFEKIIAIKRILPTMGEDRDFIKMFIDEAKIAGQLAHANICQIFELGRIDGSHFIAMEYIWGKDLLQIQNRLRKLKQPMPIALAAFVIAKVLEGLDYAHRKRDPLGRPLEIVHRDCSPQNVLVSYEGEVKVIDFGIAKATSRNSRTMAGVLKGKFGYMSPEQVRGLPLDRRSDIFALGTMLYECLTSERLFQGETDFSTLEKVRNVDIPNPRAVNPAIPEAIERVILKALAKDVDDRYQWCSEMLADLQAYLMSQDAVFTAKSLAGWLKDVFATEIERERQQLEQYKRVGRDGLIAGLPSAEAKVDVIESLGEAGQAEGDPTTLGGPSLEDLEQAIASSAAPEVGPAPGSPASRGGAPAHAVAARPPSVGEESGDADFGEEAPTEIFGELEGAKPDANIPAAGRPPTSSPAGAPPRRSPTQSQPIAARAPAPPAPPPHARPPAGRPPTAVGNASGPMAAMSPNPSGRSPAPNPSAPTGVPPGSQPQAYPVYGGPQSSGPTSMPAAIGTPGAMPVASMPGMSGGSGPSAVDNAFAGLSPPSGGPARTLLGSAPVGLPGVPGYGPGQPPPGAYGQPPSGPYGQPPHGQAPHGQPPHGQAPHGQPPHGQPPGPSPYGQPPPGASADPYGQNPQAHGQNPQAHGQNPQAHGQNPSPYGQNPSPYGQNPQPYGAPHGQNPSPHGQNPSPHGQNPSPHGQNPSPHGQNPSPYGQDGSQPQAPYGNQPYGQSPAYGQNSGSPNPFPAQPPSPYPLASSAPYGGTSGQFSAVPVVPLEGAAPAEPAQPRKKSSIGRDVAIGVGIAAVVLGGFLVVKFAILDKGGDDGAPAPATIRLQMPAGVAADLFVDEKKLATVTDQQEIPVAAGERKVRLVGPNGAHCDQTMKLAAHQTTTLVCKIEAAPGPATPGAGSAAANGSDAGANGSNTGANGSNTGANGGSNTVAAGTGSAGTGSAGAGSAGTALAGTGSAGTGSAGANGAGSGSVVAAGSGSAGATVATDKMPPEVKSSDQTKPPVTDKPVVIATKEPTPAPPKPADKTVPHVAPVPPKPAKPDEDMLGSLDGGGKPAANKPAPKTPAPAPKPDKPVEKTPAPAPKTATDSSKGYLQAYSKPSAHISVDGADTGLSTPIAGRALALAAGKHKITFTVNGDKFTYTVTIKAGATETLSKDLQ